MPQHVGVTKRFEAPVAKKAQGIEMGMGGRETMVAPHNEKRIVKFPSLRDLFRYRPNVPVKPSVGFHNLAVKRMVAVGVDIYCVARPTVGVGRKFTRKSRPLRGELLRESIRILPVASSTLSLLSVKWLFITR